MISGILGLIMLAIAAHSGNVVLAIAGSTFVISAEIGFLTKAIKDKP